MSDKESDPVFVSSHPERPIVTGGQGAIGEPETDPGQHLQRGPAPGADPWAHRSISMRCSTCMWYVIKGVTSSVNGPKIGRCRRHAPSHISIGWPAVFPQDWCGDHKLDEVKI